MSHFLQCGKNQTLFCFPEPTVGTPTWFREMSVHSRFDPHFNSASGSNIYNFQYFSFYFWLFSCNEWNHHQRKTIREGVYGMLLWKRLESSRRNFVKALAAGSISLATPLSLMDRSAPANPLSGGVSPETSDKKSKYGKCIVKLPISKMGETVMFAVGADKLNGFPCNIIYAFGLQTGPLGLSKEPHVHDHDEAVYFIGSDPKSAELGAEVRFQIGPGDGGAESHVFSVPTVVVIPKGVWHCPMETLKFEKPFLCMAVSLTTKYETQYWSKR
jgi:hypothetical protein